MMARQPVQRRMFHRAGKDWKLLHDTFFFSFQCEDRKKPRSDALHFPEGP